MQTRLKPTQKLCLVHNKVQENQGNPLHLRVSGSSPIQQLSGRNLQHISRRNKSNESFHINQLANHIFQITVKLIRRKSPNEASSAHQYHQNLHAITHNFILIQIQSNPVTSRSSSPTSSKLSSKSQRKTNFSTILLSSSRAKESGTFLAIKHNFPLN
jgi:hypothetical protein